MASVKWVWAGVWACCCHLWADPCLRSACPLPSPLPPSLCPNRCPVISCAKRADAADTVETPPPGVFVQYSQHLHAWHKKSQGSGWGTGWAARVRAEGRQTWGRGGPTDGNNIPTPLPRPTSLKPIFDFTKITFVWVWAYYCLPIIEKDT